MLLFVCLVLVTWNGAIGTHIVCDKDVLEACEASALITPKTKPECERFCLQLTKHMKCLQDYLDSCGSVGVFQFLLDRRFLFEEKCRRDPSVFLNLTLYHTETMECIKKGSQKEKEACNHYVEQKLFRAKTYSRNRKELWPTFQCMSNSLLLNCVASRSAEMCGPYGKEIAMGRFLKIKSKLPSCNKAKEDSLSKILKFVKLEPKEETFLKNFLF